MSNPVTYLQHTHRLRRSYPGRPDVVSERPRHKRTGQFLDADNPTTVTFTGEEVNVDIDFLLRIGAIAPLPAQPAPPEPPAGKKGGNG